jgi:UDP-N-acetylmuramoyl-tripeptide--D-alanyl-D-alanine ligase
VIPLLWDEVVELELGELRGAPGDGVITRVHDDSRATRPGDLFIAINSGTRFLDDALARGAATLAPNDQHEALAALARLVRRKSSAAVVAVVGSTGKTSTKDALAALCGAVTPTIAAEASKNNEIGLPLTVLRLEPETEVLITEMGMRGLGQIAHLCSIAQPRLVVVPSIGPEHLELVGTIADVARANAEAIEALPEGGIAVVPADAPELAPYLERDAIEVRTFDRSTVERLSACDDQSQAPGALGRWGFRVGAAELKLQLPFDQRHLAENVLAALTAYDALGLPLDRAQEGARGIRLSAWRGEVTELPGGGVVVNDAYNANPTSMRAALLDLAERSQGRRRVAILGEMAELGVESGRYHAEIAALLETLGIEVVIGVGEPARAYLGGAETSHWIADAAAFPTIAGTLRMGDAILVKASRAVSLEGIGSLIENLAGAWSES